MQRPSVTKVLDASVKIYCRANIGIHCEKQTLGSNTQLGTKLLVPGMRTMTSRCLTNTATFTERNTEDLVWLLLLEKPRVLFAALFLDIDVFVMAAFWEDSRRMRWFRSLFPGCGEAVGRWKRGTDGGLDSGTRV